MWLAGSNGVRQQHDLAEEGHEDSQQRPVGLPDVVQDPHAHRDWWKPYEIAATPTVTTSAVTVKSAKFQYSERDARPLPSTYFVRHTVIA